MDINRECQVYPELKSLNQPGCSRGCIGSPGSMNEYGMVDSMIIHSQCTFFQSFEIKVFRPHSINTDLDRTGHILLVTDQGIPFVLLAEPNVRWIPLHLNDVSASPLCLYTARMFSSV